MTSPKLLHWMPIHKIIKKKKTHSWSQPKTGQKTVNSQGLKELYK